MYNRLIQKMFETLKGDVSDKVKLDKNFSGNFSMLTLIDGLKRIVEIASTNLENQKDFYQTLIVKIKIWKKFIKKTEVGVFTQSQLNEIYSILDKSEKGRIMYYNV